jgi:hypothetical protein
MCSGVFWCVARGYFRIDFDFEEYAIWLLVDRGTALDASLEGKASRSVRLRTPSLEFILGLFHTGPAWKVCSRRERSISRRVEGRERTQVRFTLVPPEVAAYFEGLRPGGAVSLSPMTSGKAQCGPT